MCHFLSAARDAIGTPLAAWLASSFQNGGIEDEEIHAGVFPVANYAITQRRIPCLAFQGFSVVS
jgi:hypothetical protein